MEVYLQRKEYEDMTNGRKGSRSLSYEVRVGRGVYVCGGIRVVL